MDINWYPPIINIIFFIFLFSGIILTTVGLSGNLLILISSLIYAFYTDLTIFDYFSVNYYHLCNRRHIRIHCWNDRYKKRASIITIFVTCIGGIIGGIIGSSIFIEPCSIIGVLVDSYILGLISEFYKQTI